jgi:uncharacterized protein
MGQPRRFRGLGTTTIGGRSVPVASSVLSRLAGLALLPRSSAGAGLLIPRCRSVHTFGMRFPLDVVFLGDDGSILRRDLAVGPARFLIERQATAVLELPAVVGQGPS